MLKGRPASYLHLSVLPSTTPPPPPAWSRCWCGPFSPWSHPERGRRIPSLYKPLIWKALQTKQGCPMRARLQLGAVMLPSIFEWSLPPSGVAMKTPRPTACSLLSTDFVLFIAEAECAAESSRLELVGPDGLPGAVENRHYLPVVRPSHISSPVPLVSSIPSCLDHPVVQTTYPRAGTRTASISPSLKLPSIPSPSARTAAAGASSTHPQDLHLTSHRILSTIDVRRTARSIPQHHIRHLLTIPLAS